jgi:pimeloyl-ACP methyl ester carboxylesterase
MRTYRLNQQQQACANWRRGVLPKGFLLPVKSSIPTLLLSGSLDPVTPTTLAKEIARHLSNSKLVIVPTMSHIFDGLSNENCFDELVMGFISNPGNNNLKKACIENMLPPKYKVK